MSHEILPNLVSRQVPEFVREDYPTFVAFVEAYYEYLKENQVDFSKIRDIDETLDSFIEYFKKQLAVNLPIIVQDERMLLQHIKDQYLAKGSEGSYKLLFRLLFSKNVELTYPGNSMLIPSDGAWNQEISVFVDVDYGDPEDVVGRLVEISSGDRVLSVLIDRKEDLIGEIDRVRLISDNVYEMYLDKRFFGEISPGDKIRYLDEFQATILPATTVLNVTQPGKNFRVGQVFELQSGTGTGALVKVTQTNSTGGILRAEIIKFGIGYTANFAISVLSSNSVTAQQRQISSSSSKVQVVTYESAGPGTINYTSGSDQITGSGGAAFGTAGDAQVGDELWTDDSTPLFIGVIKSIESTTEATLVDNSNYTSTAQTYTFRNDDSVGSGITYVDSLGATVDATWTKNSLGDQTQGFEEQGYISAGDVFVTDYVDATFAGTILREFALNSANAQTEADEPAIIEITLGALNRYPGYFESNSGFLSDSIFIQDSFYYQKFSYVVRLDERLSTYKSAVKTMVHPAGMRLFGEFDITNRYDLSLDLESLVKSLGITISDDITVDETDVFYTLTKGFSDSVTITEAADAVKRSLGLNISGSDSFSLLDEDNFTFGKSLETTDVGTLDDTDWIHSTTKGLEETSVGTFLEDLTYDIDTSLEDTPVISETLEHSTTKYIEDNSVGTWSNRANVYLNSYNGQDYWIYTEEYEGGLAESTTN